MSGDYFEVSNASKAVKMNNTHTKVVIDESNNIVGFIMELSDVFNSMSLSYNWDTTKDDLKAKLGDCKEIQGNSKDYLLFEIKGCNVYIEDKYIYGTYSGNTKLFITNP